MLKILTSCLLFFLVFSCTKNEAEVSKDPESLSVEILSIDTKNTTVEIQASATNAVLYNMYVGQDENAVLTNTSGLFNYNFGDIGTYDVTVRAYGESGRYIKKSIVVSLVSDKIALDSGYFSPTSYAGYTMVWSDEFDGTTINTNDWVFETGAGGWGNNEWQYYRRENAWVSDGALTIEARQQAYSGSEYTSARMITKDKQEFKYGRIDIRALLPEGQGIWPALWMLGENISSVGWPACGEIDIMEMIGGEARENTVYGTLHWDLDGHVQSGGSKTLADHTFADKYHVFSITWDETTIKWYVDNEQYYVLNITPDHMTEFHQNFFIIFNIALGGSWPGYPDATTKFPQQMKVDYIRVFQ